MQAQQHEGCCAALLNCADKQDEPAELRQIAAITLKNAVKQRWHKSDEELANKQRAPIAQADKEHIRQHLHVCITRCVSASPGASACLHRQLRCTCTRDLRHAHASSSATTCKPVKQTVRGA